MLSVLKNMRISVKLVLVGTIIMIVPLVIIASVALHAISGMMSAESQQMAGRAKEIARVIDRAFVEETKVAMIVASDPAVTAAMAAVNDKGPQKAQADLAAASAKLASFAAEHGDRQVL